MSRLKKLFDTYFVQKEEWVPALGPSDDLLSDDQDDERIIQNRDLFKQLIEKDRDALKTKSKILWAIGIGVGVVALFGIFAVEDISKNINMVLVGMVPVYLILLDQMARIGRELTQLEFLKKFAEALTPEHMATLLESMIKKR